MFLRLTVCLFIFASLSACKKKTSDPAPQNPPEVDTLVEISDRVITENLNLPWELLWGPDNMLWMSEREGRISSVDPETGKVSLIANIDEVFPRGEGGLLGMAVFTTELP